MSWFTDFAGKAEDFLNRVDQGAATALSRQQVDASATSFDNEDLTNSYSSVYRHRVSEKPSQPETPSFISAAADNIKKQKATLLAGTANISSASPTSLDSNNGSSRPSSHFVRPQKKELDDDLLFDFLNSSDKTINGKVETKKEKSKIHSSQELSRTSSLSSLSTSTHSIKASEDDSGKSPDQETPESSDSGLPVASDLSSEETTTLNSSNAPGNDDSQSHVLSNLRLENKLLRSEVSSLNQEMVSLVQRLKETQEDLSKARTRVDRWNADNSKTDQTVRELRSQVDDLTEAVSAKDAQLAVLKVRLDEADQLLKSRTEALEAAQSERSRILQDHNEGSSLHTQALQTLQERLQEAEVLLRREQDASRQVQSELSVRLNKVEIERQSLAESLTAAEKKAIEEKRKAEEFQQQMKSAKASADSLKQELVDYKQKATRILQSKEKLISSLKEGSGIEGLDSFTAASMEIEELRHEREMQREEAQRLTAQIQQLRAELQDMERQQLAETESSQEQLQELQDQLACERRLKQEAEAEVERQRQELKYLEEELHRTKSSLQSRIRDREEEIQKLRNQLTNKTLSSSSQLELENRLHQLTETLIQKQTMLEALSTEKNSLVFQLERLEQQLKNMQGATGSGPTINMTGIESTEGARMRNVPVLFGETESQAAGMYGKVRKAASTIDKFSIRLGIFLRRYPMARVFVIIYMAILHFWVMIVLLTYTPEMHNNHPGGK
ncbi:golgin subfamily A member 5 isoform X1 [Erpetoichthys calabaricus]|uniref:Golgin subfamily A member 5 n=1 Tax=Erpetoichthys calabaricus TaxID=27687 RepID=A0A8C4SU01_ERPCA|nr:golgin subfamily A member 5 isoform X1 [Erpetoichthys calabaricus]XP_051775725.1 golgin subfamily A member 5 isoform X1 [Erpetoichthys calabaricus]